MRLNKSRLVVGLMIILGGLYTVGIVNTYKVSALLVEKPARLWFTVVVPDKNQCSDCFDTSRIITSIGQAEYIETTTKTINLSSRISQDLIERYSIKKLPALIVSGDISDERVVGIWPSLAGEKKGGNVVIQNLVPYFDLAQQKPKGVVEAVLLKDETCQACFSEDQYLQTIQRLGMVIGNATTYDIGTPTGKGWVNKYKIKKVPSLILSPDAAEYPWFTNLWKDVGSKEQDGWLVFRQVQKVGEYQNLEK